MRRKLLLGVFATISATCVPSMAIANDLGCQVLICLSNPGGATQYSACVPPMVKLWERLALGGSFPGCSGSGVVSTKVYDRGSSSKRRVVMTFPDGRQQTYSLANLETLPVRPGDPGAVER